MPPLLPYHGKQQSAGLPGPLGDHLLPPRLGPKMAGLCYSPPPEGEPQSLVLAFMAITVASLPGTSCSKKPCGHSSLPKPAELPRLPASPRVPFFSCGVLSVPFTQQHRPQAGEQARPESLPGEERSPQPLMCTAAPPPTCWGLTDLRDQKLDDIHSSGVTATFSCDFLMTPFREPFLGVDTASYN